MRRLLFDLNVVLDVLFERAPHVTEAAALWRAAKDGAVLGLLPAHDFTTVHYLLESARFCRLSAVDPGHVASLLTGQLALELTDLD